MSKEKRKKFEGYADKTEKLSVGGKDGILKERLAPDTFTTHNVCECCVSPSLTGITEKEFL